MALKGSARFYQVLLVVFMYGCNSFNTDWSLLKPVDSKVAAGIISCNCQRPHN